ncbi:SMI1/KNR4 family protein [Exiguobacterium qingdaonense]|uniref:SMI1/KNR4 family protein n=1 Tax=Exiguobacterium qingdaonense TaxID=2751251 RepID=UPI001F0B68F8|nr:SMI1/KNR4 family protein [Exiguobacterium qingdaonense]
MVALEALKRRLVNGRLEVQMEEGYVDTLHFSFNAPATEIEIKRLTEKMSNDVIQFLKNHNGAELFVHPTYGGGIQLFSVDEIIEYREVWECPERFIPVGAGRDGEWIVCEVVNEHENYIWVGEFLTYTDDIEKLPMDYTRWFDYLIVAQGAHFWDWFRG